MPKCKNDETRNYKGTEPSPKGLGYCAHAEPIGKVCKGRDKEQWKVSKTKNGVKRWVKFTNEPTKKTPKISLKSHPVKSTLFKELSNVYDLSYKPRKKITRSLVKSMTPHFTESQKTILDDLLFDFVPTLNQCATEMMVQPIIKAYIVELPISKNGLYMIDYVWSYVEEVYGVNPLNDKYLIIPLKTNADKTLRKGPIQIQHNGLTRSVVKKYEHAFKLIQPHMQWNGKKNSTVDIIL